MIEEAERTDGKKANQGLFLALRGNGSLPEDSSLELKGAMIEHYSLRGVPGRVRARFKRVWRKNGLIK